MTVESHVFDALLNEGFYEKYNDLFISDRLGWEQTKSFEQNLQRLGLGKLINPKTVLVLGKGCKDIQLNETFDVLFPHKEVEANIEVKATLRYVNLSPGRKIDYLPKGYTGICLLDFKDGIPDLIDRLKVYGDKQPIHKHRTLYLSQRPILDRILELMKED